MAKEVKTFIGPKELEDFLVVHGLSNPGAAIGVLFVFFDLVAVRQPESRWVLVEDLVAAFLQTFDGFYVNVKGEPLKGERAAMKVRQVIQGLTAGRRALENRGGRLFASVALLRRFPQLDSGRESKILPPPVRFR